MTKLLTTLIAASLLFGCGKSAPPSCESLVHHQNKLSDQKNTRDGLSFSEEDKKLIAEQRKDHLNAEWIAYCKSKNPSSKALACMAKASDYSAFAACQDGK